MRESCIDAGKSEHVRLWLKKSEYMEHGSWCGRRQQSVVNGCADDWDSMPASAQAAQLPAVQPDVTWGLDAALLQQGVVADDGEDDDGGSDGNGIDADVASELHQTCDDNDQDDMLWLRDLDAACQDL